MPNAPSLVVGAGPVGLTAALTLAHLGQPVRIIDSNAGPTTLSKALVLWRRSLITLDPFIPVEEWIRMGVVPKGARIMDSGRFVAEMKLENSGHALPGGVLIPQSDVETRLIQALAERGVEVERQTSLKAFEARGETVQCVLEGPDGRQEIETPWLLGCDGAHSTVRHTLGLEFPGEAISHRWLLGDIEVQVEDGVNPNAAHSEVERDVSFGWICSSNSVDGGVQIFPIKEGRFRLFVEAGPVDPATPRQDPTIRDLQEAIHRRTRLQWRITDAHWLAEFRINERQVAQYVHGRVFVSGDAAHVHSPAGGQGMNTGLQDAANLTWKLSLASHGVGGESLVATYQEERHPVAARVLEMSGKGMRATMLTSPLARGLQDLVVSLASHVPAFRRKASAFLAEDDVAYLESRLAGHGDGSAKPGGLFPDVPIEQNGTTVSSIALLRRKRGEIATLVLLGAAHAADWPQEIGGLPLHAVQLGTDFSDPDGALQAALDLAPESGVLVRADGVIAASGEPANVRDWIANLPG